MLFLFQRPILSHHAGEGQTMASSTRFIDPFTGKKEKPLDYILITQDYQKGTIDHSNLYTTTLFGETFYSGGKFALNFSIPWIYYRQIGREDAARYGKPYLGFKWNPFIESNSPFFILLEARLGFPSGGDSSKFTGGDYYSGLTNVTVGASFTRWLFVIRGSGIFPLSTDRSSTAEQVGVPYWAQSTNTTQTPETSPKIQKVTQWFGYVTYRLTPNFNVFAGYLIRIPYVNVIGGGSLVNETPNNRKTFPRIFREISSGFSCKAFKGSNLTIAGRFPLDRDSDIRLYDYAITTSLSVEISDWRKSKSEGDGKKSDEPGIENETLFPLEK
ncbi:LIC11086 family outer membrane transporter [Leptospira fainei]